MPEAGDLHRRRLTPPVLTATDRVVIVGASLAGTNAAATLRKEGFAGELVVVDADPSAPYDRPPLSKQVLSGDWDADRIGLLVRPGNDEGLDIDWRVGVGVERLDVGARRLDLVGGGTLDFDGLLVATGAHARHLPGTEGLGGLHVLRTLADSLALRADLDRAPSRVVVVGAGFIGAEVASVCRGRGIDVTVLEAAPVPLARVLGEQMGAVCADLHRAHGVELRLSTGVEGFVSDDGHVSGVRLSDGSVLDAEVVVVGVGAAPEVGWLEGSGVMLDDGVRCDEALRVLGHDGAPLPGLVAAGDVARFPNACFGGEVMRVEHWENAVGSGTAAAHTLLGSTAPWAPVPWFWSDQYDRKIQLAGWTRDGDEVRVVEGSVEERRFVALYGREGRLVGVLGFNRPAKVIGWRARIEAATSWDDALAEAASAAAS